MTVGAGEQIVKLKKGSTEIYIESAKVEESIANKVIKVLRPLTKSAQDSKNPGTILVDLKRIEHIFNITGFLSAEPGSGNESYADAKAVKDALVRDILYPSGDIELHYRGYTDKDYGKYYGDSSLVPADTDHVKVIFDKVTITDAGIRKEKSASSPTRYNIILNLTRGKIK